MSAVHTPMPHDLIACRAQDNGTRCDHSGTEAGTGAAPEVADIFRAYGDAYRATHRLSGQQLRVMQAIETCRTSALGGHLAQCDRCGAQVVRYHSCGNRHCPKCQTLAKLRWVQARLAELLDIPYFHCVLTLPHTLNPLAQGNPQLLYGLLFQSASATLQTFGRDPKWLGGELGLTLVLHTWGQTLEHHIHVHGIVTVAPSPQMASVGLPPSAATSSSRSKGSPRSFGGNISLASIRPTRRERCAVPA